MDVQQETSPLAAGTRLDAYNITGVAAYSRYGITYEARDDSGAELLIKEFLPQEFAVREDGTVRPKDAEDRTPLRFWLRSFLDQAQLLQKLNHPGLVRIVRQFEANGTGYHVTERPAGETLAAILQRSGTLGEAQLRRLLAPVLSGLEQAHAVGLVHRDIRPEHLRVRTDDSAVLTDFGVLRAPVRFKARTVFGSGQPPYAAPEEFYMAGPHGPWTDLYALGAVAYRVLVGQAPPDSRSRASGPALAPVGMIAQVRCSEALAAAVDQALQLTAERRPQSVAAWRAALQGEVLADEPAGPGEAFPPVPAAPTARRAPLPMVAGAVIVVAAAGGAWYWFNSHRTDQSAANVPAAAPARADAAPEQAPASAAATPAAGSDTTPAAATSDSGSLDQLAQNLMDKEKKLAEARDQLAQRAQAAPAAAKADSGKSRPAAEGEPADGAPAAASAPSDQEAAKLKQLQDEVDRLRKEKEAQQAATAAAAAAPAARPAAGPGPEYQAWYRQATATLRQSVNYPKSALEAGDEGEIIVQVKLRRDGTVLGTQLQQRSASTALNREAIDVFSRVGHFQPVPQDYSPGSNEVVVTMPIDFKMGEQ